MQDDLLKILGREEEMEAIMSRNVWYHALALWAGTARQHRSLTCPLLKYIQSHVYVTIKALDPPKKDSCHVATTGRK